MFNQNFFSAANIIECFQKNLIKNKGKIICISAGAGTKFVLPPFYEHGFSFIYKVCIYLGQEGVRINIVAQEILCLKVQPGGKK